jgi:hypothetical protein
MTINYQKHNNNDKVIVESACGCKKGCKGKSYEKFTSRNKK